MRYNEVQCEKQEKMNEDSFQVGSKLFNFYHEYNQSAYQFTYEGMESNFLPC